MCFVHTMHYEGRVMDHYEMAEAIDAVARGLSDNAVEFVERVLRDEPPLSKAQQQWIEDLYEKHVINRGIEL